MAPHKSKSLTTIDKQVLKKELKKNKRKSFTVSRKRINKMNKRRARKLTNIDEA